MGAVNQRLLHLLISNSPPLRTRNWNQRRDVQHGMLCLGVADSAVAAKKSFSIHWPVQIYYKLIYASHIWTLTMIAGSAWTVKVQYASATA
ncbi:hypothetical protein FIBSPDRAFT_234939 [Athelia psychrophila]|uniref:Uncharacterized protein n=1 Tax=Athelia psychrophila TaxID=1759441 RepID=A0A166RZ62_9AGAM|nr:hypothetical protein FIBSPDRAFT_234939 [Fibularhizoctonia sp. CBS 109695]